MTNDETRTGKVLGLEPAEWWFLVQWVLASTVGLAVQAAGVKVSDMAAFAIVFVVLDAADKAGIGFSRPATDVAWAAYNAIIGAVIWSVLGTAQWMVLRKRIHRPGGWVWASVVGGAVGWAVGWDVREAVIGIVDRVIWKVWSGAGLALLGAVHQAVAWGAAGTAQWIVLRKRVHRSGRWVLASIVAGAVAGAGVGAARTMAEASGEVAVRAAAGAVSGVVAGLITGSALARLLRHPLSVEQEPRLA